MLSVTILNFIGGSFLCREQLWKPHLTERRINEEHAVLIICSLWALSRPSHIFD